VRAVRGRPLAAHRPRHRDQDRDPAVADHLDDETRTVTGNTPHMCAGMITAGGGGARGSPLLATSNQWGQTPFPPTAMSRLAVSRQARDLLDGIITVHRELPVR
jgi:hypothetical protein